MSLRRTGSAVLATIFLTVGLTPPALAEFATDWQTNLQAPVTPVMERITSFHDMLLWIIIAISVFVLLLMLYVMWKFSEKRNPTPTRTTHNTLVEVLWTVIPVVILVLIAVPSFKLLYLSDVVPKADLTIKAIGHQWYWAYEYPDNGNFTFDATLVEDEAELAKTKNRLRLLETDNSVVVPVDTNVRVIVTASDVLHSWAVPAFGVKTDAVPGRLNETWFKVTKTGTYYGQCSELCGVRHGFMPIRVEVVSKQDYQAWVQKAQKEFASADGAPERTVARLQPATR